MKKSPPLCGRLSVFLFTVLAGSLLASNPLASQEEDRVQEELFRKVDSVLEEARKLDASEMAPELFRRAMELYRRAEKEYDKGESLKKVRSRIDEALKAATDALEAARVSNAALGELLAVRREAMALESREKAAGQFSRAERDYQDALKKAEKGDIRDARKKADKAIQGYREMACYALIKGPINDAERELKLSRTSLSRSDYREAGRALDALKESVEKARKTEFDIRDYYAQTTREISRILSESLHPAVTPIERVPGGIDIGTGIRGLTGSAAHVYLPENRFHWWGAIPPPTGAISVIDDDFSREFSSALATVVGGRLEEIPTSNQGRVHTISWDSFADGSTPNDLPAVDFFVPTIDDGCAPAIEAIRLAPGGGRGSEPRRVLVDCMESVRRSDPSPSHRSISIHFAVGQRAVGLEYGFHDDPGREIDPRKVRLIARGSDGRVLVETHGETVGIGVKVVTNTLGYRVGVRHRDGEIRSVELRVEEPVRQLFVQRIWYEPLPPAVVKQGVLATEGFPNLGTQVQELTTRREGEGASTVSGYPVHFGTEELRLPFRCDRAVTMMRGFKLYFLDQRPHEIRQIEAGLGAPYDLSTGRHTPAIFEVERGGTISLEPHGMLTAPPSETPGFGALIFYTVLAWDSDRMDIQPVQGSHFNPRSPSGVVPGKIELIDPCRPSQGDLLNKGLDEICGNLFGGLQGFEYRWSEATEIEGLSLEMGEAFGGECKVERGGGGFNVKTIEAEFPALERGPLRYIDWNYCTRIEDVDLTFRRARGTVLTGESIRLKDTPKEAFTLAWPANFGRRSADEPYFLPADRLSPGAWPLRGDMAFLSLGAFTFAPDGPVRELEIEVHGLDYDGERLGWQIGAGISTTPPVSGGGIGSGRRFLYGWPQFGAVARTIPDVGAVPRTRDIVFDSGIVGSLSMEPDQAGELRNDGNVPFRITGVSKSGPHMDEFNFYLEYQGSSFRPFEFTGEPPLDLWPGESLTIRGRFFPQADAGGSNPPRTAQIDFATNAPGAPIATVSAFGRTVSSQSAGSWLPSSINFGFVDIDASNHPLGFPTRNAILESTGPTPLQIYSLELADTDIGFSATVQSVPQGGQTVTPGTLYEIPPGSDMVIQVRFAPESSGEVETRLVARTSAGTRELRLIGEGVRP